MFHRPPAPSRRIPISTFSKLTPPAFTPASNLTHSFTHSGQPIPHRGRPAPLWSPRPRLRPVLGGARPPLERRAARRGSPSAGRLRHAQVRSAYSVLRPAQPRVSVQGGVPSRRARRGGRGEVVEEGRERARGSRGSNEVDGTGNRLEVCIREMVRVSFSSFLFSVSFCGS